MSTPEGHNLSGMRVSVDDAISEVTKARAAEARAKRDLAAVTKDRDELLREFTAMRDARPLPPYKPQPARGRREDFVRIAFGDVHGCMMDRAAVEALLADLRKWQPDEIVIGGDMVECGGFLAAHHALGYVAQTTYSWQEDIEAGNWLLDRIQEAAPKAEIHYLEGNHEDRVERWVVDQTMRHSRDAEFLRQMLAPDVLLRLKERGIRYYRRSEVTAPGLPPGWVKLGKIFFVHELSGGKNAAAAAVGQTAGNVVYFHSHQEDSASRVLPGVGLVKAWNPGCLCQQQPLWRHSNPTNWTHGYAIQFIDKSGEFLHLNIPIWEGRSLVGSMHDRMKA